MIWTENWAFSTVSLPGYTRYYAPTVNQLQNYADFSALFDLYKINAVKLTFQPRYTGYEGGTGSIGVPYISLFVDGKSNTNITGTYSNATYNSFLEQANGRVKTRQLTKPVSIYWKPLVSDNQIVGSGNPTVYRRCPWLSTANGGTIPMRGLYAFIHDNNFANASGTFSVDVFVTMWCQFKGSK